LTLRALVPPESPPEGLSEAIVLMRVEPVWALVGSSQETRDGNEVTTSVEPWSYSAWTHLT
jgi:hypothetical protein